MGEIRLSATVRKVGNSYAVIIPIQEARKADIRPGSNVDVTVRQVPPDPVGLLAHVPYVPFKRSEFWRDRI